MRRVLTISIITLIVLSFLLLFLNPFLSYAIYFKLVHPLYNENTVSDTIAEAVKINDPLLCEKLPATAFDSRPIDDCYRGVAKEIGDSSLCYKTHSLKAMPEFCVIDVAAEKNDLSICDNLVTSSIMNRWACYGEVAESNLNFEICDKIEERKAKERCFKTEAYYKGDASICEKIDTSGTKDSCFLEIAIKNQDIDICRQKISNNIPEYSGTNDNWRDICFENIIRSNISFCDPEKYPELKKPCTEIYGYQWSS